MSNAEIIKAGMWNLEGIIIDWEMKNMVKLLQLLDSLQVQPDKSDCHFENLKLHSSGTLSNITVFFGYCMAVADVIKKSAGTFFNWMIHMK